MCVCVTEREREGKILLSTTVALLINHIVKLEVLNTRHLEPQVLTFDHCLPSHELAVSTVVSHRLSVDCISTVEQTQASREACSVLDLQTRPVLTCRHHTARPN